MEWGACPVTRSRGRSLGGTPTSPTGHLRRSLRIPATARSPPAGTDRSRTHQRSPVDHEGTVGLANPADGPGLTEWRVRARRGERPSRGALRYPRPNRPREPLRRGSATHGNRRRVATMPVHLERPTSLFHGPSSPGTRSSNCRLSRRSSPPAVARDHRQSTTRLFDGHVTPPTMRAQFFINTGNSRADPGSEAQRSTTAASAHVRGGADSRPGPREPTARRQQRSSAGTDACPSEQRPVRRSNGQSVGAEVRVRRTEGWAGRTGPA